MQTLLDKLTLAGWIKGTATVTRENKKYILNIIWTDVGRKNLAHFFRMTSQIEAKTKTGLSGDDLAKLKSLAGVEKFRSMVASDDKP
jgi:hypothetical protein